MGCSGIWDSGGGILMGGSGSVLVLVGAVGGSFGGFGSVVCTAVVAGLGQGCNIDTA